jgi:hypothetical protein
MAEIVDLIAKRQAAYKYITETFISRRYLRENITNTILARQLGGTVGLKDALDNLQSGTANPTPTLVDAFKAKFQGLIFESTIYSHLVHPFE